MQTTSQLASVAELVSTMLARRVVAASRTSSPDAFVLDLGDRQVVAKSPIRRARSGSVLVEAWVYHECRKHGIKTPNVIAVQTTPECMVVEKLPGRSIRANLGRESAESIIWARAGEDLRKLHAIRMKGFGLLRPNAHGRPSGESQEWCPFVRYTRTEGLKWLVDAGYLTKDVAHRLELRYDEAAELVSGCTDGRLLHGDLCCLHVFKSSRANYSGIIDFGKAQAGDPLWDIARLLLWDDNSLEPLLDGYGRDTVSAEELRLLVPLYLLAYVTCRAVGHDSPDYINLLLRRSRYSSLL